MSSKFLYFTIDGKNFSLRKKRLGAFFIGDTDKVVLVFYGSPPDYGVESYTIDEPFRIIKEQMDAE